MNTRWNRDQRRAPHPLDTFLKRTHKGHCELFASAFALMLRAQGIPSRIATGYYSSEFYDDKARPYYIVRQSDAHAWVEAWLDGYGWLTFDPTPPDWRGRTAQTRDKASMWSRLLEWSKGTWQSYVLDYSGSQQARLIESIMDNRFGRAASFAFLAASETVKGLLLLKSDGPPVSTREIMIRVVLMLVALALTLLLIFQVFIRSGKGSRGRTQRSTIAFMNQLIQRLHALGWKRPASQTPAEWFHGYRAPDRRPLAAQVGARSVSSLPFRGGIPNPRRGNPDS